MENDEYLKKLTRRLEVVGVACLILAIIIGFVGLLWDTLTGTGEPVGAIVYTAAYLLMVVGFMCFVCATPFEMAIPGDKKMGCIVVLTAGVIWFGIGCIMLGFCVMCRVYSSELGEVTEKAIGLATLCGAVLFCIGLAMRKLRMSKLKKEEQV